MQNKKYNIFKFCFNHILYPMIITIVLINISLADKNDKFKIWVDSLRVDAQKEGISTKTFDEVFKSVKIIDKVIELDKKQPETKITFQTYLNKIISNKRIKLGKKKYFLHKEDLDIISEKYKVQSRFIMAIWGIETNYGSYTGKFPLISSLVTLAFEGRRAKLFRKQLLDALKIIENDNIKLHEMKGSWAGAMGQSQFMPSSYIQYAQDFDKDGIKNIWDSHPDIFASIAYYLQSFGWDYSKTWGREVIANEKVLELINLDDLKDKPLSYWDQIGFKKTNGKKLPKVNILATLLLPDGLNGKKFLVYNNFNVIKKYNASNYYSLSVGLLADGIIN